MPSKAQTKLGDLLRRASGARAPVAKPPAPPMVIKSVTLTPGASAVLERLIVELSQGEQRKVSASAVMRALLRYADAHAPAAKLAALVHAEIATGEVVWGKSAAKS